MDWMYILEQIFRIVIFPLLGCLTLYLVALINTKRDQLKKQTDNETAHKYFDMLDKTITECVIATTQTYVETLKKQGAFDEDAQKVALQKTYENIMKILTNDAKKYLETAVADLNSYILNKIEAEVKITKAIN